MQIQSNEPDVRYQPEAEARSLEVRWHQGVRCSCLFTMADWLGIDTDP